MKRFALGVAVVFVATINSAAEASPRERCLNGLAPVLIAGSFTGSTNCREDRLTISKAGTFRVGRHRFDVYDYHYALKPVYPTGPRHGGQRVILIRDGRYLGQYGVMDHDIRVALRGRFLSFSPIQPSVERAPPTIVQLDRRRKQPTPSTVRLDRTGWPRWLLVDGDEISFFR